MQYVPHHSVATWSGDWETGGGVDDIFLGKSFWPTVLGILYFQTKPFLKIDNVYASAVHTYVPYEPVYG